jgi:rhamnogalacturonyl hydrolase YesR
MVPPFLAYYGVLTANRSLVSDAYNQIRLYRSYLSDAQANGLWRHIRFGSMIPPDDGHWSTGTYRP